jgi:hypothetical protein
LPPSPASLFQYGPFFSDGGADHVVVKLGWFYNRPTQIPMAFSSARATSASAPGTVVFVYDPQTQQLMVSSRDSDNADEVSGHEQLLTGTFLGSPYEQAFLFYIEADNQGSYYMTAQVVAPRDVNNPDIGYPAANLQFGDSLVIDADQSPEDLAIAVGNFRGTGQKDIAVLLPKGKVNFYAVDPATLNLSLVTTATLSAPLTGVTAMAAGRYRTPAHDDLVVLGTTGSTQLNLEAIAIEPAGGSFTAQAVRGLQPIASRTTAPPTKLLAQAGPLQDYTTAIDQLLIAESTDSGNAVSIYSFDQNLTTLPPSTTGSVGGGKDCIYDMVIGNFDHQNPDNSRNLAPSVAFYVAASSSCAASSNATSQVQIWPVDPQQQKNWLSQGPTSSVTIPGQSGLSGTAMVTGDLQGRSVRLGEPEKVTITGQLQPDLVLGLPPMHADWIDAQGFFQDRGCVRGKQCLVNLTVLPTVPAGKGFSTAFSFSSTTSQSASRKTTTSWSVGVKSSIEDKISFGIPDLADFSTDMKLSFDYTHQHSVEKNYNTYNSEKVDVSVTTGFHDFLLYSEHRQNFYYYPVVGHFSCPAENPQCPNDQKLPLYVVFSVPDQVIHSASDASQSEWYQPVHEPGNVFSYPWKSDQLANDFHANPLTQVPAPVQQIGTFSQSYSTTWSQKSGQSSTTGSTNSFSEGLGLSFAAEGETNNFTASVDVNSSQSFGSLNVSTQELDASEGVAVNNPGFGSDVGQCCFYAFSSYVLGSKPFAEPFQDLTQNVDINTTGPLYVAFNADSTGGNNPWWAQVYNLPDIGLNHPFRWKWSNNTLSFNLRNANIAPEDDPFYQMKGFFITPSGAGAVGPNITEAIAGDKVLLTARVYNFSLVDTLPGATIFVSFFGQEFDGTGLVGDSFFIGDTTTDQIPGYQNTSDIPNWILASVPFDTTNYAGKKLVFWVLVFMTGPDGNLAAEMPGHGLTSSPAGVYYTRITDVPTEDYSNNVGLYGTYSPFFVAPPPLPGAVPGPTNGIATVSQVAVPGKRLLLDQRVKVTTTLNTSQVPASPVSLIYYDGNPAKGGQSFAEQTIPYIGSDATYSARVFYQPNSCGLHPLFVVSRTPGASSEGMGRTLADVVIDPVQAVEGISNYIASAGLPRSTSRPLRAVLDDARKFFAKGDNRQGIHHLHVFDRIVRSQEQQQLLTSDQAQNLIGQAKQIIGCVEGQS